MTLDVFAEAATDTAFPAAPIRTCRIRRVLFVESPSESETFLA